LRPTFLRACSTGYGGAVNRLLRATILPQEHVMSNNMLLRAYQMSSIEFNMLLQAL
jgi:hypothetical protein